MTMKPAMTELTQAVLLLTGVVVAARAELLQNGGFEVQSPWQCWTPLQCTLTSDRHSGQHAMAASGRQEAWQGPTQYIQVTPGQTYRASAWMKLLDDHNSQSMDIALGFEGTDGSNEYQAAATHSPARTSEGWVHLQGTFTAPHKPLHRTRIYYQSGPSPSVRFVVDEASVTQVAGASHVTQADLDHVIDQKRKSNINFHVTTAHGINKTDVKIHVMQKKKSFPFGTAVSAGGYNSNVANGKYRDFIHRHFNWIVPENALKWYTVEAQRGHLNYGPALDLIHGVKSHGIKVRGHNLLWSAEQYVQNWIKQLSPTELRTVVRQHVEETMNRTRGLLEHWDVDNELLHGQWYQDRLQDPDYDIQVFRMAHHNDPNVKLFLNDYNVVSSSASTGDYLIQANRYKAANVGLYGMGVQCHFGDEHEPDASAIKLRLDILAQANLSIWVTELDVVAQDENTRADYYEKALRALYGHPAVDGILFWGFWDHLHWRGPNAALVKGDNFQLTAAGRRVLDLFENQWMTDETHVLSQAGDTFTVRGFHGDYEVHVVYQGRELSTLKQTFSLGKGDHRVNINVHT